MKTRKRFRRKKEKQWKVKKKCECQVFFFDGETDDKCIFFAFWHTTSFYSIWKCSLCEGDFEISRRFLLKMLHGGIGSVQEYDP